VLQVAGLNLDRRRFKTGQIMQTLPGEELVSTLAASTTRSREELPYRLRQQSLLGEFGRSALQTRDFAQILQRATELCAQGLEAPFAKVLE
jgi:two-component system, sensor histidine kinase PdtaS